MSTSDEVVLPDDLMPLKKAADLVGVHWNTIRSWIRCGRISGWKIGWRIQVSRGEVLSQIRPMKPDMVEYKKHQKQTAKLRSEQRKHTRKVLQRAGI